MSRRLWLESDPPGARVLVDGREVGTTPYETEFLSYGTRRVELELDGYERRIELVDVALPWWQFPPLDLVTDLLLPWTIRDERHFAFALEPLRPDETDWDDARAAQERMRAAGATLPDDGGGG